MEMKRISSGRLCEIGYDARSRTLEVRLDDGSAFEYSNVGSDLWQRFSTSGSAWSFYRDNIEEEYPSRLISGKAKASGNPLDELFGGR